MRERLVAQGAEVYRMVPAQFSAFFERERKTWAKVVADGNIKVD